MKSQLALRLLDDAISRHNPRYVIALFSGGHDSLVATHIASRHPRFSFAAHINTGIGIEKTREFVRNTCADWGIELREYCAADYRSPDGTPSPQVYTDFVKERGFPGPAMHTKMYNRLKERPLRHMIRDLKRGRRDKVLLVTGIRSTESTRRMAHVKIEQVWEGTKVWFAPIWDFDKKSINEYVVSNGLQRNIVADLLHMSGECLCGAFAHPGEKEEIRLWFPETAMMLDRLEEVVRANGFPWGWEERPPKDWLKFKDRYDPKQRSATNMLCAGCMVNSPNIEGSSHIDKQLYRTEGKENE